MNTEFVIHQCPWKTIFCLGKVLSFCHRRSVHQSPWKLIFCLGKVLSFCHKRSVQTLLQEYDYISFSGHDWGFTKCWWMDLFRRDVVQTRMPVELLSTTFLKKYYHILEMKSSQLLTGVEPSPSSTGVKLTWSALVRTHLLWPAQPIATAKSWLELVKTHLLWPTELMTTAKSWSELVRTHLLWPAEPMATENQREMSSFMLCYIPVS